MKVLVPGGNGQVGRALMLGSTQHGFAVFALDRAALDITDPKAVYREINKSGADLVINAAAYTGARCIPEAGHVVGDGFSVQANMMLDDGVWPAMAEAFAAGDGPLAERLVGALRAAQDAGGDGDPDRQARGRGRQDDPPQARRGQPHLDPLRRHDRHRLGSDLIPGQPVSSTTVVSSAGSRPPESSPLMSTIT